MYVTDVIPGHICPGHVPVLLTSPFNRQILQYTPEEKLIKPQKALKPSIEQGF